MDSDIEKCAMLIMKSKKREATEGIELQTKESTRILDEGNFKKLEISEADAIKQR